MIDKRLNIDIKKIIDFRQKLHKFPELSGKEKETVNLIKHFISRFNPLKVYDLNSYSVAFEFGIGHSGKTIMFRADIDALAIYEDNELPYRSVNRGISHKCGHDGHTAILAGLAEILSKIDVKDRIILLFQSAEETLSGALDVIGDKQFHLIKPDVIIGFHNIPGYEQNSIIVRKGEFNAYVSGIKVIFRGRSFHAAYAKENMSFLNALINAIKIVKNIFYQSDYSKVGDLNLTYLMYGSPSFGISPDELIIHLVARAYSVEDLENIMDFVEKQMYAISNKYGLEIDLVYTEDAPAIYNDEFLTNLLVETVREEKRKLIEHNKPFSWGEDFGFYTIKYKGIYFGFGAGKDCAQLHSKDYDFPDQILLPSIEFLFKFYLKLSYNL